MNQKITNFEKNTECELIMVVREKSDDYPVAKYRAGIVMGLILSSIALGFFHFHEADLWVLCSFVSIMIGILFSHFIYGSRFFIHKKELHQESLERAYQDFFKFHGAHELQRSILFFVSQFEKKVHLLMGDELVGKIPEHELKLLIQSLKPHFKAKCFEAGISDGVEQLEILIKKYAPSQGRKVFKSQIENKVWFLD